MINRISTTNSDADTGAHDLDSSESEKRLENSGQTAVMTNSTIACGLIPVGRVDLSRDESMRLYARIRHARGITITGPWSTVIAMLDDAAGIISEARR